MDEQREKREQMIIDVAKAHFEKFGYRRTVIDDIVREVGIAKGTFYLHFQSKQELYLRVIQRIQEKSLTILAKQLEKEQTPAELIRNVLYLAVDVLQREPLVLSTLRGEQDNFVIKTMMAEPGMNQLVDSTIAYYRHILEEGIRVGEFRENLNLKITPFILGTVKFLFPYQDLVAAEGVPKKEFWDCYIELLMQGMLKSGWKGVIPKHRKKWGNPYAA
jgi:AcrR family transcriptional regulator